MNTDTDKEIRKLLPESINLHSMVIQSFSMQSDPVFVNYGGPFQQLLQEEITTTFELIDSINRMQVTLTLKKTLHHKITN